MDSVRVVELHTSEGLLRLEMYDEYFRSATESFVRLCLSGQVKGPVFEYCQPNFLLRGSSTPVSEIGMSLGVLHDGSVPAESRSLCHVGAGLLTCGVEAGKILAETFYITLSPQPKLDGKYCIFGRVYSGMSVLDKIRQMQTNSEGKLYRPVTVERCAVLNVPRGFRPLEGEEVSASEKEATRCIVHKIEPVSVVDSIVTW